MGLFSKVDLMSWYDTSEFLSSKNIPASSNMQSGEGFISCNDSIKQIEIIEICPPDKALNVFN